MTTPAANTNTYRVVATITVNVRTHDPTRMLQTAEYRFRDLKAWLFRHEKDIQNEMAWCDEIALECRLERKSDET